MAEQKYAKYFVTTDKPKLKLPSYRHTDKYTKRVVHLDADTVPGAKFYNESMWLVPGDTSKAGKTVADSHTHTWGQFLGFFGFNYENVRDLGAEIEFTIDGEKHIIKESFAAFIPAGIQHGPLTIRNVVRPIFHFSSGSCEIYE